MSYFFKLKTVFLCCSMGFYSFSQNILWEKSFGGKHADVLFDVQSTPDYGFLLAGSSISGKTGNKSDANKGDLDYCIWKMNEKGDLDWQKSYGGDGVDMLKAVQLTIDGGFILAGTSASAKSGDKEENAKGDDDFWILKLDAIGRIEWQKTLGGLGQEKVEKILLLPDNSYLIAGSSASYKSKMLEGKTDAYGKSENTFGNLDYWVVKLDKEGKLIWQKTIGGQYYDELKDAVMLSDGSFFLGGYSNSPVSGNKTAEHLGLGDFWLVQLSAEGDIIWQETLGGAKDDQLFSMITTIDKGILIGGHSNSETSTTKTKNSEKGTDFWLLKFNENKEILWQETYNFGSRDVLTSIIENKDETLVIAGYAQSEQHVANKAEVLSKKKNKKDIEGISDYIVLKLTKEGKELWSETVGSAGEEVMKKALETRDGGYVLCGSSKTEKGQANSRDKKSGIGGLDFWIVKLRDKDKTPEEALPLEAFPNPTTNFTNVILGYDYEEGSISLYDLNGRQLQTQKLDGSKTVPISLQTYPIGIYIIEANTNKEKHSIKIIKK